MSPILVRPVREQFEHDRVIRLLQARYKRKFDVVINPGAEQNASVPVGELAMFPDLVLFSQERGRRLQGTIEVETGESVNTLEAMAEWGPFSRLRAPFVLYVPPNALDTARRLCTEHQVVVSEIWTYHTAVDQVRFTMVHRAPESQQPKMRPEPVAKQAKPVEKKEKAQVESARPEKPRAAKAAPARVKAERKPAKPAAKAKSGAPKTTSGKKPAARKAAKPAKAAKKSGKSSKRK